MKNLTVKALIEVAERFAAIVDRKPNLKPIDLKKSIQITNCDACLGRRFPVTQRTAFPKR